MASLGADLKRFVEVVTDGDFALATVRGVGHAAGNHGDARPNVGCNVQGQQLGSDDFKAHEVIHLTIDERFNFRIAAVRHLIHIDEQVVELLLGDEKQHPVSTHARLILADNFVFAEDGLGANQFGQSQARVGTRGAVDVIDRDLLGSRKIHRFVTILADVGGAESCLDDSLVIGAHESHCVRLDDCGARRSDFTEQLGVPFVLKVNVVIGKHRNLPFCVRRVGRDGLARAGSDKTGLGFSDEIEQLALTFDGLLADQGVNSASVLLDEVLPVGVELSGVELI